MSNENKPFGTIVHINDDQPTKESHVFTISKKVAAVVVKDMDKFLTSTMFEAYKDTDISELFVLDEEGFQDFLNKMLPLYFQRYK